MFTRISFPKKNRNLKHFLNSVNLLFKKIHSFQNYDLHLLLLTFKQMITNETNRYVSPYENDLRRIFNEKNKSKTALISSWDTLSLSDRGVLKKIKGNWKWLHLLLKDYIPSMPLWSNLIHSISNNVKHVGLSKRLSRLMISKDKRINQIKRIQLAERVHRKTDLVISSLAKDLCSQVANADVKQ